MQLISCHKGQLQRLSAGELASTAKTRTFKTGLRSIDHLLPAHAFPRGSVHELLTDPHHGLPLFFAALLARSASLFAHHPAPPLPHSPIAPSSPSHRAIAWCDPHALVYPPALAAMNIPLDRVLLLRPKTEADEIWALTECLRSPGVAVTVGSPGRLSRTEARRLQLAAEAGGGVGILLRTEGRASAEYAAATRWRVRPVPADERTLQHWELQLIHGHGGHIGQAVLLEACRETNAMHAAPALADRPVLPRTQRKRA